MRFDSALIAFSAAVVLASCSRAHDADAAGPSTDSSSTEDAPVAACDRECLSVCRSGNPVCICVTSDEACADHIVDCPTGARPPECTASGGILCNSAVPAAGAESAICLRDTGPPGATEIDCQPGCIGSGSGAENLGCFDWRRGGPCEGWVVRCPTAVGPPICDSYRVLCESGLPGGGLETPICVRE